MNKLLQEEKIASINYEDILRRCDHTLLKQTATMDELHELCDDAITYHAASVCIPPCYVVPIREFYPNLNICTVIGFPNGYNSMRTKIEETKEAIISGANEIDMVINIGYVKSGNTDDVLNEIRCIKNICDERILKVIIETCLLSDDEKIKMCEIVTRAGADYIKTSTGFAKSGATAADVKLLKSHIGSGVLVKAAGGISSFDDAKKLIEAGADRLGTSRLIALAKEHANMS